MNATLNEKAIVTVEGYFEHPGIAAVVDVDAFYPNSGWIPVTRDSLFTVEGVDAARAAGVTTFAVQYGGRSADFAIAEVAS